MTNKKSVIFSGIFISIIIIAALVAVFALTASAEKAVDLTVTIDTGSRVTLTDKDGDGYYDIGTADELYAFAAAVNAEDESYYNAELVGDITVNTADLTLLGTEKNEELRLWMPIGTYVDNNNIKNWYGTFEGNGYTISGIYCYGGANDSLDYVGLFCNIAEGATVRNLNLENSYFYGRFYVGSIASLSHGAIENCHSNAVIYGNATVGGILGDQYKEGLITHCTFSGTIKGIKLHSSTDAVGGIVGYAQGEISYCYFDGELSSPIWRYVGGIVGQSGEGAVIKYCYNTGSLTGDTSAMGIGYGGILGASFSTSRIESCYSTWSYSTSASRSGAIVGRGNLVDLVNCFYLTDSVIAGGKAQGAIGSDSNEPVLDAVNKYTGVSDFSTGEAAYKMNGHTTDGTQPYYQVVGSGMPVFKGPTVYLFGSCSDLENVVYTNIQGDITHVFEEEGYNGNGICPCGVYEPAPLFANYYEISNPGHLYWFAELVNNGNSTANARLTSDIVFNEGDVIGSDRTKQEGWIDTRLSVGTDMYPYEGSFDGQEYTLSGLFQISDNWGTGIFGTIGEGGAIKNVNVDNSYFYSSESEAAVLAYKNSGLISGCTVNAYVDGLVSSSGLVSRLTENGIIEYSSFKGTVYKCERDPSSQYSPAGGIVSRIMNDAKIRYCIFEGKIWGSMMAGGIAAIQNGGEISYCLSNGIITDCRHNPDTTCRNASNYVGGISGWMTSGSIKGCLNLSTITAMNCGGIVGVANNANNIQNSYYLAGCATSVKDSGEIIIRNGMSSTSSDTPDDIISCTTAADAELLASGEVTYHLNGDQSVIFWKQTIGEDPLPAFDGDNVYYDSALDRYINHEHIWSFTKNDEVISAVCTNNCFYTDEKTMWISSPESLTFDGGFKEVILLGELAEHDIAVIVYEGDRLVDGKPYYIGDYSATVTVGEYSLSVSYTISHEHESLTHVYVDGENHALSCVCGYTVLEPHVNEDALHSHCDICNERIEKCNYTNGICEHGCLESPQRALDGYYEIANAGQLLYYFKNISVDEYTADFIRLIDDIDLSSVEWRPVRLKYGVFDGNGHTINIIRDWTEADHDGNFGLFDTVDTGKVRNLTLTGEIIADTGHYMGAVAGILRGGRIEGVVSYVKVTNHGTGSTGGLVGLIEHNVATIRVSAVYADVTGQVVGGVVGLANPEAGGFELYSITYAGDVSGTQYAGAIIGQFPPDLYVDTDLAFIYYYEPDGINICGFDNGTVFWTNDVKAVSLDDFKNYKILEKLGHNWGQTVGVDLYPIPGGPSVYFGYTSCAEDALPHYTNNPSTMQTKPDHEINPATCTEPEHCANGCGYTVGSPLGHDMADATCTSAAVCLRGCGHTEGDVLGHDIVQDEGYDPTCTEQGLTHGSHCSRCDAMTVPQEEIPASGHSIVTDEALDPTCTESGLTEGEHCECCDGATVAQETIPALGHEWSDATYDSPKTCTVCGETEGEPLERPTETTDGESETIAESETETKTETESETESVTETESETEAVTETEAETETETATETENESVTETESEKETETETEADTETETETDIETETETYTETETETADSTVTETESLVDTPTETEGNNETETEKRVEAPTDGEEQSEDASNNKSGCSSSIGMGFIGIVAVVGAAISFKKKKE